MAGQKFQIVGLGEILWDLFPEGRQLGGAPANFAYISNLLGNQGVVASRVGVDTLGQAAIHHLTQRGISAEFVQRDPSHPTGTVRVQVDGAGQPGFEIAEGVAWDFLEWTENWKRLASQTDAVCFGSLAQRSAIAGMTIRSFLHATRPTTVRVFDVNLRQRFFTREIVQQSIGLADIVKLNHEELPRIMNLLELVGGDAASSACNLLSSHNLKLVCITRGSGGSLLVGREQEVYEHPGFRVPVIDTVGSGDAFTAALVCEYLRGSSIEQMSETANRVGAWVATQAGGMPVPSDGVLEKSLAEIGN